MKEYDVIVVGAGSGAKLIRPAADAGKKVAVIEKGRLGGTCLNRGCIPSKMLIHVADMMTNIREARRFGIKVSNPKVDFKAVFERVNAYISQESAAIGPLYREHANIDYYPFNAAFLSPDTLQVADHVIRGKKIFLPIGATPRIPPIDGLADTPFMTSTEALAGTREPKKLLIIGGGYIACELGYLYAALGVQTEFLVRRELLQHEDADIKKEFQRAFCKQFSVHLGAAAQKVQYDGMFFVKTSKGVFTADALLVATGICADTEGLSLDKARVVVDEKGYICVNEYLQTSQPHIFAYGDAIGRHAFRHTANAEGEYLFQAQVLEEEKGPIAYAPVPHAIFTHPQVAGVGPTEEQLKKEGVDYFIGRCPYRQSAMGEALLSRWGLVKLLFEKGSERLLAGHIVGEEASDMIHTVIALLQKRATLFDMLFMIYVHPALPEVIRNAARDAKKK